MTHLPFKHYGNTYNSILIKALRGVQDESTVLNLLADEQSQ